MLTVWKEEMKASIFTSCWGTNIMTVLIGVDDFSLTDISDPHSKVW